MSGRRVPLSQNQNVANSPLRTSNAALKQKRSIASLQREEVYAQAPPAKKQILESGIPRPLKSPSQQQRVSRTQVSVQPRRTQANSYENKLAKERGGHHHTGSNKYTEKDLEEIRQWQNHHRARFPKMVFYFENIPNDIRVKLAKQIASLGAREEKFFSIDITHVVTTRPIPPERTSRQREEDAHLGNKKDQEQMQTIDPSLLNRSTEQPVKRKLFTTSTSIPLRKPSTQIQDARPKRNMDVLYRAREMDKKIWSLEKVQRMLALLLEQDPYTSCTIAYGPRGGNLQASHANSRASEEMNLTQLLQHERANGPSDRDAARELHYFKGPYIYVYDFEEKHKPIMVREYNRVQDKSEGDWPQFRTAALGRCPFIEDYEHREIVKPKPKVQVVKPAIESKPILHPPKVAPAKPVTGKRSLSEMESTHTRGSSVASNELINPAKPVCGKGFDFRPNAFTSRAAAGKLFGGEPVASGVQPSNVTSAIRSQMISSTAATPGAIGVLSKEVHGLQRQVLKRNSSNDVTTRRTGSVETVVQDDSQKSLTLGRTSSRKLIDEVAVANEEKAVKARVQAEKRAVVKPKKRDPKPGYCENCQDKFDDFDDHIASRKHRRFAENPDNWAELDDLLSQLEREPKHKSFSTWAPTLPQFPAY